ncbi:Thiopurine S-methyltransferase (TPMT) [Flexibacter flexilis DSM 6793]|uniref:Thiopurine S-methyltransferase (TPMT) n=1 Tax=Flexibacter flexilis DSM 6793 TaxID=927664 RepID=A0A1I1DCM4_9BACT|nr:methyltransferase domain-containing protein [Flexibacter flexilis]SFB70838.1 Thiopurine S-methyltransferase (TPMT) [Flexibacter flexilis DSM 6793]
MDTIAQLLENPRQYWQQRYQCAQTGWDMGEVSPPLKAYFDSITQKDIRILIPGCGNGYEADYLLSQGFTNVTMLDIAPEPIARLTQTLAPYVGKELQLIEGDFFELNQTFDLIVEQTFFCALPPVLREKYAQKMPQLLANEDSRLVGVMFNDSLNTTEPPFGGFADEYRSLLGEYMNIYKMELCANSHTARQGRELFVEIGKK